MSNTRPLDFCLLIPCYNNFNGLIESLKSVYYPDNNYLILVVDDGSSTPVTIEKVSELIGQAIPLMIIRNATNEGITSALNKGLIWIEENTDSKYIARLDCGDTCHKDRFTLQVSYMNAHPKVALVGTWCRFEERDTKVGYDYKTPTLHKDILKEMYCKNVFIHPTVMMKSEVLKTVGYYPVNFEYAEDYALFWKIIKVYESAVINTHLVICEINLQGISEKNKRKQLVARFRVVKAFGSSTFRKFLAFIKLVTLFFTPKRVILKLKKFWK